MYCWEKETDQNPEKCVFTEHLKRESPILRDDQQAGKILLAV
jgi:hypothetical protein